MQILKKPFPPPASVRAWIANVQRNTPTITPRLSLTSGHRCHGARRVRVDRIVFRPHAFLQRAGWRRGFPSAVVEFAVAAHQCSSLHSALWTCHFDHRHDAGLDRLGKVWPGIVVMTAFGTPLLPSGPSRKSLSRAATMSARGGCPRIPLEIHKSLSSNGLRISSLIKVVSLLARTYGKNRRIPGQPPRMSALAVAITTEMVNPIGRVVEVLRSYGELRNSDNGIKPGG